MIANGLLIDGFTRVHESVQDVLDGLSTEQLLFRPSDEANSIAWLLWHLTRVQDDHFSDLAAAKQQWHQGWADKFELPYEVNSIGYGHSSDQVSSMKATAEQLQGYYNDVHVMTLDFLKSLGAADYKKVIDPSWNPPVTLAVRVMSVLNDVTQHVGQAAYVKGLL